MVRFGDYGCRNMAFFWEMRWLFMRRRQLNAGSRTVWCRYLFTEARKDGGGFNQAEYLAARISRQSGIPIGESGCQRKKDKIPEKTERTGNGKRALQVLLP